MKGFYRVFFLCANASLNFFKPGFLLLMSRLPGLTTVLLVTACDGDKLLAPVDVIDNVEHKKSRPNILLVVADDLGYSDLGAFGGEIDTPNLDKLAQEGVRLSSFYATPACSTTRASLLSGTDYHLTGLGSLPSAMTPNQKGLPGYEGYLNSRVLTIPELMRDAGYATYMSGKWHLGTAESSIPANRGFDRSFVMLTGAGGHFDDLGAIGPQKTPYQEDGRDVALPEDFYSTRTYTDKLINQIEAGRERQAPFFAYLAYSAPHWPLQAPEASIAKYRGKYDKGFGDIQAGRVARQKSLGVINEGTLPFPSDMADQQWIKLSEEERKIEVRKMEIYAAMIDDLDKEIARLVDYLKRIGEYDNTYIFFMSDNGPEGRDIGSGLKIKGKSLDGWITSCCDNSYENMGKGDSYLWSGSGWAWTSAAPLRGLKVYTHEGGIRVPAFVSHPGLRKGAIEDSFATIKDIMPTFLELGGITHPGTRYQGRNVLPMQGASLVPLLNGEAKTVHDQNYITGWEFLGRRALRKGDWKIVSLQASDDRAEWQLFNISSDPTELNDIAQENPVVLQEMVDAWDVYAAENNIVLPDFSDQP